MITLQVHTDDGYPDEEFELDDTADWRKHLDDAAADPVVRRVVVMDAGTTIEEYVR